MKCNNDDQELRCRSRLTRLIIQFKITGRLEKQVSLRQKGKVWRRASYRISVSCGIFFEGFLLNEPVTNFSWCFCTSEESKDFESSFLKPESMLSLSLLTQYRSSALMREEGRMKYRCTRVLTTTQTYCSLI
jgi:hypothetical protein